MDGPTPHEPQPGVQALHLAVFASLAFTAPLYSALGDKPMFFSVRQAGAVELLLFVFLLSVVLPAVAAGLPWLARKAGRRVGNGVFLLLAATMLAAIALPPCKRIAFLPDPAFCGLAAVLGIAGIALYWRFPRLRVVATILSPILIVSPAFYLFATPTSQLLLRRSVLPSEQVRVGNPVPLVMVVFDELSTASLMDAAGKIDAGLFPNFAAMAEGSTWFRNATSVAAETEAAMPGILTGNLPQPGIHELDWHEYSNNLFMLLRDTHEYSVVEPCTGFCPESLRGRPPRWTFWTRMKSLLTDAAVLDAILILPRRWPVAMPDVTGRFCNFAGTAAAGEPDVYEGRREILEGFIEAIRPGPRPGFYFLHSVLPHAPWCYLPSGRQYDLQGLPPQIRDCDGFAAGAAGLDRQSKHWPADPVVVAQAEQRYLLQAQYVDRALGRLVRRLKEVDLYDRCLLVVTADHGVSFVPGEPFRGVAPEICGETLGAPLFMKLPGQEAGRVIDRNVEAIDILPTIAEVMKIRLPWVTRGASALDESSPPRPEKEACVTMQPFVTWKCDARSPGIREAAARKAAMFPETGQPDGLFPLGPHGGLVGRSLAKCRVLSPHAGRAEIHRPERLATIDRRQDVQPLLIGGRVEILPPTAQGSDLAISVNGVIRAVARSFHVPGYGEAWTAMLPEDCLQDARNEVRVFRIEGPAGGAGLRPLEAWGDPR